MLKSSQHWEKFKALEHELSMAVRKVYDMANTLTLSRITNGPATPDTVLYSAT